MPGVGGEVGVGFEVAVGVATGAILQATSRAVTTTTIDKGISPVWRNISPCFPDGSKIPTKLHYHRKLVQLC